MSARSFVDTNIFVYAVDESEPVKSSVARQLLTTAEDALVISAQVISEFYVVATGKLGISGDLASARVDELLRLPVVPIDGELTRSAIAIGRASQISYWDGLIVAAAAASSCDVLLTEDLHDGATIGGVRIENPFAG